MNDIRKRIEATIDKQSALGIDHDDRLRSFNWMDLIQLTVDLETEFNVNISDYKFQECKSVTELTEYVESLVGEKV